MARYLNPSIWDDLSRDIYGATGRVILEIFLAGGKSGMKLLPERIAVLQDWGIFSQAAQEYLKLYRLNTVANLTNTTRDKAIGIINDWIQSGDPLDMLVTRLEPWLGSTRAERIAVTEVTRTYASGNIAAWKSTGLVGGKKWATARDELVCFPAGTMITTTNTDRPIEDIKQGDVVVSSSGPRRVLATNTRVYSGNMTLIRSDGGLLFCTANHPIWHIEKGWLDAGNLKSGDAIQSIDNKPCRVIAVCNFPLTDSNHNPTVARKILRLAQIAGRVLMPIITVNLKRNLLIREKKVDGVTPNLSLLDKLYARSLKNDTNRLFKECLRSAFSVTGERTELSVSITGERSDFLTTRRANDIYRRAAAFLRTIVSFPLPFTKKCFSAPFALDVLGSCQTASAGTNGISISDRCINSKAISAYRTCLSNSRCFSIDLVTRPRTESLTTIDTGGLRPIGLPTLLTNNFYASDGAGVIAGTGTKVMVGPTLLWSLVRLSAKFTSVLKRHGKHLLTILSQLYHALDGKTIVYNIQVEGDPTYYANGILVHNCPICGPLDGQLVDIDGEFELKDIPEGMNQADLIYFAPPAHVRCRCYLQPFVSEELLGKRLERELGLD